jgi:hypothetical protein
MSLLSVKRIILNHSNFSQKKGSTIMSLTAIEINYLQEKHNSHKIHGAFRYNMNVQHKKQERIKNAPYQKIIDDYKVIYGKNRPLKIKGEVMPTFINSNHRSVKSWSNYGGKHRTESMELACIYDIT